jgi:hypothetical protein
MTHPLNKSDLGWNHHTKAPRAAVKVERTANEVLTILPEVMVVSECVEWRPLPDRMTVVDQDGREVNPSQGRRFYISVSTFDPYHLVMED